MKLTDDDAPGAEPGRRSSPARPRRLRVDEVAALLRQDVEAVARVLFGEPNKKLSTREELRFGRKGSLVVTLTGRWRGRWTNHETGEDGDLLDKAQRDMGEEAGLEWARRWVGDDRAAPARAVRNALPTRDTSAEDAARDAAEKAEKRAAALRLWDEAAPIEGTQAAAYLAARLPGVDVLSLLRPDVLRFHREHVHTGSKRRFPVMLAKVTEGPDGEFLAVHRTYLSRDGDRPGKAPVGNAKMGLGSPEGGGIWLTDTRARALVGEGIETTLSGLAAIGGGEWGAVVARDTSGLKNLVLPPEVREVWILVDVDKPDGHGKRPGEAAALAAAARWMAERRKVWLAFPGPADGAPCDFNDLWRAQGPAAVRAAIEASEAAPDPAQGELERLKVELVARMTKGEAAGSRLPSNIREGIEAAPLPIPLPLDAAQTKMRAAIRDWLWAATRAVAPAGIKETVRLRVRQDLAALPPDDPRRQELQRRAYVRERRAHHKADLAARLEAAGWQEGGPVPAPLLLAATVGAGKSHAAAVAVVDLLRRAPVPVSVVWLVPHYPLAEEAAARFRDAGVPVVILRGRDRADEAGAALCERATLQSEVAAQGLSVRTTLCKRKGAACPFASSCGYYRQADGIAPGTVIIATHHALRTGMLPGDVTLAGRVVIVDESPAGVLVGGQRRQGTVASLREGIRTAGKVEGVELALGDVATLLDMPDLGGSEWRTWLAVRDVTLPALERAADALREAARAPVAAPSDEDGAIRLGLRIGSARRAAARQWAAVLAAIAQDWRMARPVLQSVLTWEGSHVDPPGEAEDSEEASGTERCWAAYAPAGAIPDGVPVMALDATADDMVARKLLGEASRVERVEARQHLDVVQVSQPSFSKRALGIGKEGLSGDLLAVTRRAEALQFIRHLAEKHGPGAVAVVTYKALAEAWAPEAARLGFKLGHFGAVRGRNDMEDCRVLVMVGRVQPSRADMEADARTLFATDPEPLVGLLPPGTKGEDATWPEMVRPLATDPPDPRGLGIVTPCHPDPRIDAWFRQVRDAEVAQVIGRLRGARGMPDQPKRAYLLADVAAGVPVAGVTDLWTVLDWIEVRKALPDGPLVLDRQGLAPRAPGVIAGKGGKAVGERQQREHAERFADKAIAKAVAFRRHAGGRRNPLIDTSLGKIAGPLHVGGFIPHAGGSVTIALGNREFPADPAAFAAAVGRPNVVASVEDVVGLLLNAEHEMKRAQKGKGLMAATSSQASAAGYAGMASPVEAAGGWVAQAAVYRQLAGDVAPKLEQAAASALLRVVSPGFVEVDGKWHVLMPPEGVSEHWRQAVRMLGEMWTRQPHLFTNEMRATPAGRFLASVDEACRIPRPDGTVAILEVTTHA